MLLSPSGAGGGHLSYMAAKFGRCSQAVSLLSDWSGRNGGVRVTADGSVPGAQRQRCSRLRRAFAGSHSGQVADGMFLPLRG